MSCSSHVPTVPTCGGLLEPHFCVGSPVSPLSCTGGAGQAAQAAHPHLNFLGLLEGCFLIEKWISDKILLLSAQLTVNSGAVSLVHDENKNVSVPRGDGAHCPPPLFKSLPKPGGWEHLGSGKALETDKASPAWMLVGCPSTSAPTRVLQENTTIGNS